MAYPTVQLERDAINTRQAEERQNERDAQNRRDADEWLVVMLNTLGLGSHPSTPNKKKRRTRREIKDPGNSGIQEETRILYSRFRPECQSQKLSGLRTEDSIPHKGL
jgi:hypothetical protein